MLVWEDPLKLTRAYLLDPLRERFDPGLRVASRTPEGTDWISGKPWLVVLTATGSGRARHLVYEQNLIGFHCYAPDQEKANEVAEYVRASLLFWPYRSGQVSGAVTTARPSLVTDSTGYPAYYGSCSLLFKGKEG